MNRLFESWLKIKKYMRLEWSEDIPVARSDNEDIIEIFHRQWIL